MRREMTDYSGHNSSDDNASGVVDQEFDWVDAEKGKGVQSGGRVVNFVEPPQQWDSMHGSVNQVHGQVANEEEGQRVHHKCFVLGE